MGKTLPKPLCRLRFSLLTLLLIVVFLSACGGLWWRWEPWYRIGRVPGAICCHSTDSDAVVLLERPDGRYEVHDLEQGVSSPSFQLACDPEYMVFSAHDRRLLALSQAHMLYVHEVPTGKVLAQTELHIGDGHHIQGVWLGGKGNILLLHLEANTQEKQTHEVPPETELGAWDVNTRRWLYRKSLSKVATANGLPKVGPIMNAPTNRIASRPTTSPQHVWLQVSTSQGSEAYAVLNCLLEIRSGRGVVTLQGDAPSKRIDYPFLSNSTKLEVRDALQPDYVKQFDLSLDRRWPIWAWLSPDRTRLYVMNEESCLFDVDSGRMIASRSRTVGEHVSWDPSSSVFATYNPVEVWDGHTCDLVCRLGNASPGEKVEAGLVRFLEDHRRLLAEGEQSGIWDACKGPE